VALQYKRTLADFSRGTFSGVRGDTVDIFPAHYEDRAWRVNLFGDRGSKSIEEFDPLTGQKDRRAEIRQGLRQLALRDAAADAPAGDRRHQAGAALAALVSSTARADCWKPSDWNSARCMNLEMMEATGKAAPAIENYSRYLNGAAGPASRRRRCSNTCPTTRWSSRTKVMSRFPQLGGMYRGDFRRKATLRRIRVFACPRAWTTGRCVSRSGTPWRPQDRRGVGDIPPGLGARPVGAASSSSR